MISIRNAFAISLFAVTALMMPQGGAQAQAPDPTPVAPEMASLINNYVQFNLGITGTAQGYDYTGKVGDFDVAGRFNIVSRKGDPEITADDLAGIFGGGLYPISQQLCIRVNNGTYVIGTGGTWVKKPTVYSPPAVGTGRGPTGPYMEATWKTNAAQGIGAVTAKITAHIVRDQVRLEFTLTNSAATTQNIGLGMFIRPMPDSFPYIPGVGQSISSGAGYQFYGTKLSGVSVPAMVEFFDNITTPGIVGRVTFRNQDCTPPDYFAIGSFSDMGRPGIQLPNGYTPDPLEPVVDPFGLAEWAQKGLAPGASRTFVTYMGIGAASAAWTHRSGTSVTRDHVALGVQGPRAVRYDTTAGGQEVFAPQSFKIKAYIYNLDTDPGPYKLQDASAYLLLPKGLELAPGTSAQQEVGEVDVNSECTPVEWDVRATGDACGELEYYVSARDVGGWQQVVSRKIMVPAAKQTTLTAGIQMMSIPFAGNEPNIDHMFGWNNMSYTALYWDPSGNGNYRTLTESSPGHAFWMAVHSLRTGATMDVQLAADAKIAGEQSGKQSEEVMIDLGQGWNMIGNPYVYPIYLGQLMVYNRTTNTTVSFNDAVAKNWLSRTLFSWNSQKGDYDYLTTNQSYLLPWRGYWVRTRVPITIVFRPAVWPAGDVTALPGGF